MKNFRHSVLKQYNVGIWLGAIQDQYSGVITYVGAINFALIVPTAYHTTLREPIHQYFPWMTFWLFACFILIAVMVIVVVRWKFILPSQVAYYNYMRYKHQDLIRRDIENLSRKIDGLEKRLSGE